MVLNWQSCDWGWVYAHCWFCLGRGSYDTGFYFSVHCQRIGNGVSHASRHQSITARKYGDSMRLQVFITMYFIHWLLVVVSVLHWLCDYTECVLCWSVIQGCYTMLGFPHSWLDILSKVSAVLYSDISTVNSELLFWDIGSVGSHGCHVDGTMCNEFGDNLCMHNPKEHFLTKVTKCTAD